MPRFFAVRISPTSCRSPGTFCAKGMGGFWFIAWQGTGERQLLHTQCYAVLGGNLLRRNSASWSATRGPNCHVLTCVKWTVWRDRSRRCGHEFAPDCANSATLGRPLGESCRRREVVTNVAA